jgi:hypothetical protein
MGGIEGPFIGTEALAAGLVSRRDLRNRYEVVYRNVYLPKGYELTAATRAKAAWLWARRDATVAGLSAAALHGTKWIDAALPAELIRIGYAVHGIVIHRDKLAEDEVCVIDGMAATTPAGQRSIWAAADVSKSRSSGSTHWRAPRSSSRGMLILSWNATAARGA